MFRHFYQDGPYLEIFNTQDKTLLSKWKLPARGRKEFDDKARTYVYSLQGSTTTSKIELRKESRKGSGLVQPYVVFQFLVPHDRDFSVEISIVCRSQNRRIFLSTSQKTTYATPLRAMIPLKFELKGIWKNLCIDVINLVSGFWKDETFLCLESISVGGTFSLKRIFTMKYFITQSVTSAEWKRLFYSRIPKFLHLPHFLSQEVLLISMETIDYDPSQGKKSKPGNKSGNEMNRPKHYTLAGRYSTESLPCPVTCDLEMRLNRQHSRSQSYNEFYPIAKGSYIIINPLKQADHCGMPSQDENEVSAMPAKKNFKAPRYSFSKKDGLHKGDLNHETCTLISKLGSSPGSSRGSICSDPDCRENICNPAYEYQCSDLEVIGKKIELPCDTEEISAVPIKCEVRQRIRPLVHLDLRMSRTNSTENLAGTESLGDTQLNRYKDENYEVSDTRLRSCKILHSRSSGSWANDESQSGSEASDQSDTNSPDKTLKFRCADIPESLPTKFPAVMYTGSGKTKASVSESAVEQLDKIFERLSVDEVLEQGCLM